MLGALYVHMSPVSFQQQINLKQTRTNTPIPETIPTIKPPQIIKEKNQKQQHNFAHQQNNNIPIITQPNVTEPQVHRLLRTKMLIQQKPASISQSALYAYMGAALEVTMDRHIPTDMLKQCITEDKITECEHLEQVCNGVVNPVTGVTITKYKTLSNNPATKKDWKHGMCNELGRILQGYGDVKGTNTVCFLTHDQIRIIPKDRVVTYS